MYEYVQTGWIEQVITDQPYRRHRSRAVTEYRRRAIPEQSVATRPTDHGVADVPKVW